jgi:hypothetical protein
MIAETCIPLRNEWCLLDLFYEFSEMLILRRAF